MSPEDRALVARTLSLFERIELFGTNPECFAEADPRAPELLARWERLLTTDHDPGAFDRRLAWDGLDRPKALRVLGALTLPETFERPAWLDIVGDVLGAMAAAPVAPTAGESETAFGDYWGPWLRVARRRVAGWSTLPEPAQHALAQHLLQELARSGMQCLVHEFELFRATRRSSNDLFLERVSATPSNELYRAFVLDLHGEGARGFLELYPCLARLLATRIEQWSRNVTELADRLTRDRAELEATFGASELTTLDVGLSDSHNGGRHVMGLHFASGIRVLYKPKDLGTERAFQSLLARVNELGFQPRLRTLAVLAKDGYGWVEYVAAAPCQDEALLRDFYTRCGALLGLVTFLHGTDCHYENVIASGDQPVLIDHEALLTPAAASPAGQPDEAGTMLQRRLQASVLRTGLLPEWTVEPGGHVIDLSGIGGRRGVSVGKVLRIKNVNSDGMAIATTEAAPEAVPAASPSLELSAGDMEACVRDGLERVYRLLASSARTRDELCTLFAGLPTRFVARTTVGYSLLLRESRRPELMKDGLVQTLAMDRIARMLLVGSPERPPAWPLIRSEHAALARGDVPFFALSTDATALFDGDPATGARRMLAEAVFAQSGLDAVRAGADAMSEEELALELRLVACSFEGKAAGIGASSDEGSATSTMAQVSKDAAPRTDTPLDEEHALAVALGLAHEIRESALVYRGEHHRIGLEFDEVARIHRVALLGGDTYNGNAGIALFLGVASHVGHDERLRTAALSTVASMRAALRRAPESFVAGRGLGAFSGLGSLVYALAELSRWVDDPSLVDDARAIVRAISPAHVEASPLHDVLAGTAGLLLSLVALDRVTGTKESAPLIAHLGRRLVETAVPASSGVGWPMQPGAPPLCGMAHGNAGIAVALFEAWRLGGSRELHDVARRALAYERALRDDATKNYPDLRPDVPKGTFMATWCNGAPGIALARSRMLAIDDQADLREDLELAIVATREAWLPGGHLCCGMGGLDDILFEVARRTDDRALAELARRRTMSRITRSEREGRWPRVVARGLMRGSAGIGLGLLRVSTQGTEVPCVLDLSG